MKRITKTTSYDKITKSGDFQTFQAHHFRVVLDIFSYQSVTPCFAKATRSPNTSSILQFRLLEVGSAKDLITGEFGVSIASPRLVGPIPGEWMTRWIDSWISTVTLNYQMFPKILKRITFNSFELSWSKVSVGKVSPQKISWTSW